MLSGGVVEFDRTERFGTIPISGRCVKTPQAGAMHGSSHDRHTAERRTGWLWHCDRRRPRLRRLLQRHSLWPAWQAIQTVVAD